MWGRRIKRLGLKINPFRRGKRMGRAFGGLRFEYGRLDLSRAYAERIAIEPSKVFSELELEKVLKSIQENTEYMLYHLLLKDCQNLISLHLAQKTVFEEKRLSFKSKRGLLASEGIKLELPILASKEAARILGMLEPVIEEFREGSRQEEAIERVTGVLVKELKSGIEVHQKKSLLLDELLAIHLEQLSAENAVEPDPKWLGKQIDDFKKHYGKRRFEKTYPIMRELIRYRAGLLAMLLRKRKEHPEDIAIALLAESKAVYEELMAEAEKPVDVNKAIKNFVLGPNSKKITELTGLLKRK